MKYDLDNPDDVEELKFYLEELAELKDDKPYKPITGLGFVREDWPLGSRTKNSIALCVWNLIPKAHKRELKYSYGMSLQIRRGRRNIVVSPEAFNLVKKFVGMDSKVFFNVLTRLPQLVQLLGFEPRFLRSQRRDLTS